MCLLALLPEVGDRRRLPVVQTRPLQLGRQSAVDWSTPWEASTEGNLTSRNLSSVWILGRNSHFVCASQKEGQCQGDNADACVDVDIVPAKSLSGVEDRHLLLDTLVQLGCIMR